MWDRSRFAEYESRLRAVELGGGEERIAKRRAVGKGTPRERLETLFDPGTFQEVGAFVEPLANDLGIDKKRIPGDGVATGFGFVNGSLVYAAAQDFTVAGGSGGEAHLDKICRVLDLAVDAKAPFVFLNESGGARIEEGVCSLAGYSRLFYRNSRASGVIPQIAVILGNCAGGASYSPALCDFVFMIRGGSQMYITGPQAIKAATGQTVTMEELGDASLCASKSGQAHFLYDDEKSCLEGVRTLLGFLQTPNCVHGANAESERVFANPIDPESIQDVVPEDRRRAYDVRRVIRALADDSSFFESSAYFAKNLVVGFALFGERAVGIVANQPNFLGGALDCDASDKAARFVRFCDCFDLPIITFVDVPGFLPGVDQERRGILRHGSKLLYAYSEATVPKITLIMRKAYGGAYCAMNSKDLGADFVFAWPIAEIAVMGAEGAIDVVYRRRLVASTNPAEERERLIREYDEKFLNPYYAASKGYVDEIITPEETRAKLLKALKALERKSQTPVPKKHGNMPL